MKKVRNFFRKPLDKLNKMCYNLNVIKDRFKSLKPKGIDTMSNNKKMTKATAWTIVKGIVEQSDHPQSAELIEKIENELALLAKKNSAEKKPTAKQTANASIQDSILDTMSAEPNRLFTITELCKEVPGLPEDMTNQRMSALVRQLIPTQIERVEDKRKAYFRIVQ